MRTPLLILILSLLLGGCAANNVRLQRVTAGEMQRVLSGAALAPDVNNDAPLPDADIFGLTPEIKRFVDRALAGLQGDDRRIRALLAAVLDPEQLALKFDDRATYTAREVFQHRRANCLSFTILVVSMLRYLEIDANFNEVDVPPLWDLRENLLILSQHVNAMVTKAGGGREVLDINMEEYELHYPQRRISDRAVEAMFYNNRGMEYLLERDAALAYSHLRKALALAPELPFIWTNLGTLYRNRGKLTEAEIAYRVALQIDPANLVAISKAGRNYLDLGEEVLSRHFGRRAEVFRRKNPYYRYALARDAVLRGEYATALENIHAAISRYDKEHRFYFLQGVIYIALTDRERADASFKKALKLSTSPQQKEQYRRKMDQLI
jgi:tetratricopeptide (TPR) repeat protein